MKNEINEDNIRVAAYYIWEQAGRPEGQEKECWIKACEQLFSAGLKGESKCSKKSCKSSSSTKSTKLKSAGTVSSKSVKATSVQKMKKSLA
ncbi:MAG: DUF2934 domain-containing protein [Alphaproteobacteria bacterium]|nr:DUF2934 domain-containing protein [Alphaproteobacteria bacterium]MBQ9089751.1 DUF2934 domain-containing protein [Alphaproteobacteria bacterium]